MASETPPHEPDKGPGWIEKLAQRSTGLGEPKPAEESQKGSDSSELSRAWQFAGLGLQFAGTVGIFWLIGRAIDNHMKWNQAATLTCTVIAVIGSSYLMIKEALKANQDQDKK